MVPPFNEPLILPGKYPFVVSKVIPTFSRISFTPVYSLFKRVPFPVIVIFLFTERCPDIGIISFERRPDSPALNVSGDFDFVKLRLMALEPGLFIVRCPLLLLYLT